LKEFFEIKSKEGGFSFQGLIIKKLGSPERWKIKSPDYEYVKSIKGNDRDLLSRFARLKSSNMTAKYLQYYPEDKMSFTIYNGFYFFIIEKLYNLYLNLHVYKTIEIYSIEKIYWHHLYKLHGIYINFLRDRGEIVTEDVVQQYISKIHHKSLRHLLMDHLWIINQDND
jgi:hypothetical protein